MSLSHPRVGAAGMERAATAPAPATAPATTTTTTTSVSSPISPPSGSTATNEFQPPLSASTLGTNSSTSSKTESGSITGPSVTEPYVTTLHAFSSNIPTCLSFTAGQRIQVLNLDDSGWWDGIIVTDQPDAEKQRGWFPSNYVDTTGLEPFHVYSALPESLRSSWSDQLGSDDHAYQGDYATVVHNHLSMLRDIDHDGHNSSFNMLDALDQAISLLNAAVQVHRFKHLQPATACIISSVRCMLSATDCLTRDSAALVAHPTLRQDRKKILSALNRLVTQSRKASDPSPEIDDALRAHEADYMISLADGLRQCVKLFFHAAFTAGVVIPPNVTRPPVTPVDKPNLLQRGTAPKSMLELRSASRDQARPDSSPVLPPEPLEQASSPPSPGEMLAPAETEVDASSAATPLSSNDNMELTIPIQYTVADILKRLNEANDLLLSQIAAFIGHAHTFSQPGSNSSYLIDRTREVVDAVRSLFLVVEAVHSNEYLQKIKPREMDLLFESRESLYDSTSALVDATRNLTSAHEQDPVTAQDSNTSLSPDLVQAATGVLRTGGECVGAVKLCLDKRDTTLRICMYKTVPYHEGEPKHGSLGRRSASLNMLSTRYQSDGISMPDGLDTDVGSDLDGFTDAGSTGILRDDLHIATGLYLLDGRQRSRTISNARCNTSTTTRPPPAGAVGRARSATVAGGFPAAATTTTGSTTATGSLRIKAPLGRPAMPEPLRLNMGSPQADPKFAPSASSLSLTTTPSTASTADRSRPRKDSLASTIAPSTRNSRLPLGPTRTGSESFLSADEPSSAGGRSRLGAGDFMAQPSLGTKDLPHWMGSSYDPSDVVYNAEKQVMGGTLVALVERMTPHDSTVDPSFAQTFFHCFRFFARPIELFTVMTDRYAVLPPEDLELNEHELQLWNQHKTFPVRLRVINSLRTWLDQYWYPWIDCEVLEPLLAFTDQVDEGPLQRAMGRVKDLALKRKALGVDAVASMVLSASRGAHSLSRVIFPPDAAARREAMSSQQLIELEDMYRAEAFHVQHGGTPPAPIVSHKLLQMLRSQHPERISVMEFDPDELARQLTIRGSKLFCAILPEELYGFEVNKHDLQARSSHVKALSALNNDIHNWVTNFILSESDPKRIRELLKFFIKLGDRCYRINNFDTLMAIHNAINSSTILRLTKIWDSLGAKYRAMNDQQHRLLELSRNFLPYRQKLKATYPPAVPYLGLWLFDLTFTWQGKRGTRASPQDPNKSLINFDRYVRMGRIVSEVQRFQVPYRYAEVPEIQAYLKAIHPSPELTLQGRASTKPSSSGALASTEALSKAHATPSAPPMSASSSHQTLNESRVPRSKPTSPVPSSLGSQAIHPSSAPTSGSTTPTTTTGTSLTAALFGTLRNGKVPS